MMRVRENMFPNGQLMGSWGQEWSQGPSLECSRCKVDSRVWIGYARQQSEQTRVFGAKPSTRSRQ